MDFFNTLISLDTGLFWLINSAHSPVADIFFAVVTNLGNGWVAIPLILLLLLVKTPRAALVHTVILITLAMSLSGIANSQIKSIVKRPRPVKYFSAERHRAIKNGADLPSGTGCRALTPHVVGRHLKHRSFPSGHANTAFAAAAVLYLLGGGWLATGFAVAAIVAYSRVYLGVHFPFDTVAGGLLGVIVAGSVYRMYCTWIFNFDTVHHTGKKHG